MASTKPQNPILMDQLKDELTKAAKLRPGALVDATLLKKGAQGAYFNVDNLGTGMVFGAELQRASDMLKDLKPGDSLPAKVEEVEGYHGYIELSLSKAGREQAWHDAQELAESGEIIDVKVTGANRGGLLVDVKGLRGFLPLSQLSQEKTPEAVGEGKKEEAVEALEEFTGTVVSVKVIDVRPQQKKLIVSERETIRPSADIDELLEQYEVGQTAEGIVSGIADFGVFVKFADEPDIEGLVHISELAHRIVDSPKEVVELGERVTVKIIDIRDGRVFLSIKALKEDPWESIASQYSSGQEVEGEVYKFNPFGAVIALGDGIQGLIHVSEYGGADKMKKVLKEGEKAMFVVESVKPEDKRITLKPAGDQQEKIDTKSTANEVKKEEEKSENSDEE